MKSLKAKSKDSNEKVRLYSLESTHDINYFKEYAEKQAVHLIEWLTNSDGGDDLNFIAVELLRRAKVYKQNGNFEDTRLYIGEALEYYIRHAYSYLNGGNRVILNGKTGEVSSLKLAKSEYKIKKEWVDHLEF